jgi:hypothetical protein
VYAPAFAQHAQFLERVKNFSVEEFIPELGRQESGPQGQQRAVRRVLGRAPSIKAQQFLKRQAARARTARGSLSLPHRRVSLHDRFADQLTEQIILRCYAALRTRWEASTPRPLACPRGLSYSGKDAEVYTVEQLKIFFNSLSDDYHRSVFELLLRTGLRIQEAMFWNGTTLIFARGTILVRTKENLAFDSVTSWPLPTFRNISPV